MTHEHSSYFTTKPGILGLCDNRGKPKLANDKRFYTIAQACNCPNADCGYCHGKPHIEVFAKELTLAEAEAIVQTKELCLECGG